jgi:predicted aldo/keto reductase-like oxidoreductase
MQKLLNREFGLDGEAITRMCIKFVISTPEIDVALVGMRNPKEVEINVALASDPNDRYNLDELHNRFR